MTSPKSLLSLIVSSTASMANNFPRVSSTLKGNNSILVFDCVPEYTESYSSDLSSFPIERGSDITDHVVNKNPEIQLKGIVTSIYHRLGKTLVPSIKMTNGVLSVNQNKTPGDWKDAYKTLKGMWESRSLLTLSSVLGEHQDLIIKDLTFPKTVDNFASLDIDITFIKIRTVATKTGIVPIPAGLLKKSGVEDSGKGQGSASGNSASKDIRDKASTGNISSMLEELTTDGIPQ